MHFSARSDMLMVRIAKISASVNRGAAVTKKSAATARHWRRPGFYPVGFSEGVLFFIKMVVANAVSGHVSSGTVVSTLIAVVATVVVVVGVVVTGVVICGIVDVVTIVDFIVILNDIVVKITASAICTDAR